MRATFTLMLFLGFISNAIAQGTLKGKITDEKTGEALVGVTVMIPSLTNVAEFSDEDGAFEMKVPQGTYAVQVRYMGYTTKEVADVKIENGTVTPLNVAIKQENKINTLKDVVIRSTVKKESLNALYIAQKNSASVSDGISAEAIKKSPDKSTGEVLKRVSGTTIQDNKFVIIRGLSDRYNTGLIDNAFLPSTEANRKAFSFDIIPSSLIDNIIISKSGTPDLPGDFAGGVINILTKEIPDKNFNSISIGGSYNTVSTFKQFQTGYKSPTDILGFDNGSRKLPASIPSSSQLAGINVTEADGIKYLNALNNNFNVTNRKALPASSLQASMGRLYNMKNNQRIGLTAAVNYGHNEFAKRDVERIYGNVNFRDNSYVYNTTIGALANVAYSNASTKIAFKNLYNRTFDDTYLYREGTDASSSNNVKYYAFDLIQKAMFKTSLEGDHSLGGDAQKKLNWVVSYNNVTNSQPNQRKVQYNSKIGTDDAYEAYIGSLSKANNRLFGNLNESIVNAGVNYAMPYKLNFLYKSNLKVGVLGLYRKRDFQNRYLGVGQNPLYAGDTKPILTQSIENLYSSQNINSGLFTFQDGTGLGDKYDATVFLKSAYASSDNRITPNLRVVWGVRFESYDLNLNSLGISPSGNVHPVWNDVLPSLNSSYALSEKSNLRFSYFRSVARPELREVAPMSFYDYELNMNITGNENVTRSRINNLDLRYEVFPNPGEVISASVFYKGFDKTIENRFYGTGSSADIQTTNFGKAQNVGAEFEIRKSLDFISKNNVFKNITFYTNLSLVKSTVNLGDSTNKRYLDKDEYARSSRAMAGQSPYVINASLNYTSPSGKFGFSVLYNRIGQRIYIVGGEGQFGDVYERSRNVLDGQISYNVGKRSEFRLNVKDILNAQYLFYYDQNANKKWDDHSFTGATIDPYKDYIFQRFRLGQTFSLTYTYRF
ncbi:TonB-dependent receptor [Rurimicrobium arvi]|uniref:TonB-dependent receptor n=1 Tax=Rurimicrobium arvi TaxID=2049916 RepID=A0ABP8MQ19_9BACT